VRGWHNLSTIDAHSNALSRAHARTTPSHPAAARPITPPVTKTAIILFNLGGPDSAASVRPFLFNLFNDPAIIAVPQPLRFLLAKFIAARREKVAAGMYAELGGGSPLLPNTQAQAAALTAALNDPGARVFIAMRYWHPLTEATVREVKAFAPDRIVLLPLYPQFSTTTTGSSVRAWTRAAHAAGLQAPTATICCYETETGFIDAVVELLRPSLRAAAQGGAPRVLFSAHGLPKKIVTGGDPYQWQVEQTAAAIVAKLDQPGLDWRVTYQSRVGPLEWIGPYTEDEIERAGAEKKPLVIVPIAFVSEHSETLVELDIAYRKLAQDSGVPRYERVATVGTHPAFIAALARLVSAARPGICPGGASCPANWTRCLQREALT
jgi:protoporphyrin/coproporphyrin ferrochelatase